jgi:hypothetical protein
MAKTKTKPTPTALTSELVNMDGISVDIGKVTTAEKTSIEKLNEALAALPVEQLCDGVDLTAGGKIKHTTVVVNDPLMPTNQAIGLSMSTAAAAAAQAAASKVSMDPNIASALAAIADAPKFRERAKTTSTQAVIDGSLIQVPAAVRDLPTNLYMDHNGNYVRGEADQIVKGLFGDLSSLVGLWAGKRGYAHKPLVWLSQMVYNYVELDRKVDYITPIVYGRPVYEGKDSKHTETITYIPSIPFNEEVDENNEGLLLTTLYRCFYHLTVRNMIRIAKEHGLSVLEVLRCIVGQYDRDSQPRPTVSI